MDLCDHFSAEKPGCDEPATVHVVTRFGIRHYCVPHVPSRDSYERTLTEDEAIVMEIMAWEVFEALKRTDFFTRHKSAINRERRARKLVKSIMER